ncbi:TIGR04282 family arsenosugar biosynthesis glycosyltransferase [Hymenobacter sp. BT188]|nr:TIGR04282 family arsenosugar biosynthesis glycosyltransferase [Hymenobacter sp. BT188]
MLIFARLPELGQVKTRLARSIGDDAALAVYRELLARTRAAADGFGGQKTVWLTQSTSLPLTPEAVAAQWPEYNWQPQPPGDLGGKMQLAFTQAFTACAASVVIIGTDCPGLSTTLLSQAFELLATHDVVVGPAADGGYYLLGMNALHQDLFQNKAWSTASVLTDTLADVARLGLQVARLPTLHDVDTADDLAVWRAAENQTK